MLWLVIAVIAIGGLAWLMTGGQGEEETQPLADQVEQPVQLDEEPTATSPVGVGGEDLKKGRRPMQRKPRIQILQFLTRNRQLVMKRWKRKLLLPQWQPEGRQNPPMQAMLTHRRLLNSHKVRPRMSRRLSPLSSLSLALRSRTRIGTKRPNELDGLVRFLKSNPTQEIELLGYASSEGDPVFNQWISKRGHKPLPIA